MHLTIISVAQRMPNWVDEGFAEYAKRMPSDMALQLKIVKPANRLAHSQRESILADEYKRIVQNIPAQDTIIVLDERGQNLTTEQFAKQLQAWRLESLHLSFLIGGADGIDERLKQQARYMLRLSSMTLPHGLARVILAEQIYRAWSVLNNHPYHRAD